MKKKTLEMKIQRVPPHPSPNPSLEQYTIPADIAADMLIHAFNFGMIHDRVVADLGCGTGRLAIGVSLLGAREVYAVDVDERALDVLREACRGFEIDNIHIVKCDITEFDIKVDSVVQNPPFGAQRRYADRNFLMKSCRVSQDVATLHNAETADFVIKFMQSFGFNLIWKKNYRLPIPHMFSFHKKNLEKIHVCGMIFTDRD